MSKERLNQIREEMRTIVGKIHSAKEERAKEENAIRALGPDNLSFWEGEVERVRGEIHTGKANFCQLEDRMNRVEEAKNANKERATHYSRWESHRRLIAGLEEKLEGLRRELGKLRLKTGLY